MKHIKNSLETYDRKLDTTEERIHEMKRSKETIRDSAQRNEEITE